MDALESRPNPNGSWTRILELMCMETRQLSCKPLSLSISGSECCEDPQGGKPWEPTISSGRCAGMSILVQQIMQCLPCSHQGILSKVQDCATSSLQRLLHN
eukprot:766618-Hanusia_phi.AAC.4